MGGQARGVDELCRAVQHRTERGVDIAKIMASGGVSTPGTDAFVPTLGKAWVSSLRMILGVPA